MAEDVTRALTGDRSTNALTACANHGAACGGTRTSFTRTSQIHGHVSASLFSDVLIEANLPLLERWTGQECAQFVLSAVLDPLVEKGSPTEPGHFPFPVVDVLDLPERDRQFGNRANRLLQFPECRTHCHAFLAGVVFPHKARLVSGLCPATDQGAFRHLLQQVASNGFRFLQSISVLSWLRWVNESFVPVRHLPDQGEEERLPFQQRAELRKGHVPPEHGRCIGLRGLPRSLPVRVVTGKQPLFAERHPDQRLPIFPGHSLPPALQRIGAAP